MEAILDLYCLPPDPDCPLICMDEAAKQLTDHLHPPQPMAPGQPAREDHHYVRSGVQALFLFVDPHRGWRRVSSRPQRTRADWAEEVRRLLEEDYPHARTVRLVCDNLNTHHIASLYATFPAEQAHALAQRLELHHTPRNGSWLNIAEIELSTLSDQCLKRRIGEVSTLDQELDAWQAQRNTEQSTITWQFTTQDARRKLHSLYPICTKIE